MQCHRPTCTEEPAYEGWARYENGASAFARELGFPTNSINRKVIVCEEHKMDLIGFQRAAESGTPPVIDKEDT